MKKSELRQLIKEEIGKMKKTPEEKFLRDFNYQSFDDWYEKYNELVDDGLADVDEDFLEETKSIMDFLKKLLNIPSPQSTFPKTKDPEGNTDWRDTGEMGG